MAGDRQPPSAQRRRLMLLTLHAAIAAGAVACSSGEGGVGPSASSPPGPSPQPGPAPEPPPPAQPSPPPQPPVPPSDVRFPLHVEPGKHYLVDAAGKPFLVHGDTPWSLAAQLTEAEIAEFIDDRAAKGFTALLFQAPVIRFTADGSTRNRDGVHPFTDMSGSWNWELNDAYWRRVDVIVDRCRSLGMVCVINPAYLGYAGLEEGCDTELLGTPDARLRAYGAALARRYTQGNVIWCMGGDADPDDVLRGRQWQIVEGIREVRTGDVITAHGAPGSPARSRWSGSPGFNLNAAYPGDVADVHASCLAEFRRDPTLPFLMLEAIYEQERATPISEAHLRSQSYCALLGGACGQFFGNSPIWHFESPNAPFRYRGTWRSNLDSPGTVHQIHVRTLFSAYDWWKLRPTTDRSFLKSPSTIASKPVAAAMASDRTFAIVYVPGPGALEFDTTQLSGWLGSVRVRAYDPATGVYADIGVFGKSASQTVTAPREQVIVFDQA